jgi:hypothetical protein
MERTGLSGVLPSELGLLTYLDQLTLSHTRLNGTIPVELYSGFQYMNRALRGGIRYLYLDNSQFSGTLSTSLGLLTSLVDLYLSNNEFSGSIPKELGKLTNLNKLQLQGNHLTGSIPTEGFCAVQWSFDGAPFELVADCALDSSTGTPPVTCPSNCCTTCCEGLTGICRENLF